MLTSIFIASTLVVAVTHDGLKINDQSIPSNATLKQVAAVLGEPAAAGKSGSLYKWDDAGITVQLNEDKTLERLTLYVRNGREPEKPTTKFQGVVKVVDQEIPLFNQRWEVDKAFRNADMDCYMVEMNRHCVKLVGQFGDFVVGGNLDALGLAAIQIGHDAKLVERQRITAQLVQSPKEVQKDFYKYRPPCTALETVVVFDDELAVYSSEWRTADDDQRKSHEKRVEALKDSLEDKGPGHGDRAYAGALPLRVTSTFSATPLRRRSAHPRHALLRGR